MTDKEQLLSQVQKLIFQKDVVSVVDMFCNFIKDCYDVDVTQSLIYILRKAIDSDVSKQNIIELLKKYILLSTDLKVKNIFLNELEILEEKFVLKSIPRYITVELTTQCNLMCLMCGFSNMENKYKYSIIDDETKDFLKNNMAYFERIKWQGGEPFLYQGIYDLIRLAKENNVSQQVSTNLLVLDETKLDFLCYDKMIMFISIDGVDKKIYEQIRVGGNFESLIRKLNVIKEYKNRKNSFRLVMAVVLMKLNYRQIDQMIKFAIDYGFDEITFQEYININNSKLNLYIEEDKLMEVKKKLVMYKKLYAERKLPIIVRTSLNLTDVTYAENEKNVVLDVIDENKYKKKNFDNNIDNLIFRNIVNSYDKIKPKIFCYAPWTNLCLYTDYEIKFTCSSASVFYNKTNKEIWNNDFFVNYRKLLSKKDLSLCVKDCSNKGDQGNSIKLGI